MSDAAADADDHDAAKDDNTKVGAYSKLDSINESGAGAATGNLDFNAVANVKADLLKALLMLMLIVPGSTCDTQIARGEDEVLMGCCE